MADVEISPDRGTIDVGLHLLDRRVLDRDGEPLGRVDDLEFAPDDDGRPRLTAILLGPEALGARLGGRIGRWVADLGHRLRPNHGPAPRIEWDEVERLGTDVRLHRHRDEFDFPHSERWVREHVIGRIPGARR